MLPDDGHRTSAKPRDAADHRGIVGEVPVAMELRPIIHDCGDVIECIGTVAMARYLDALPASQVAEDADPHLHRLRLELGNLLGDILLLGLLAVIDCPLLHLIDAVFETGELEFKIQRNRAI